MSLILDALKKAEREKETGRPGVVVVGPVPWGERSRPSRRVPLALGAVVTLGIVATGTWWSLRPGGTGAPAAATAGLVPAAESSPSPAVSPSAVSPSPALAPPAAEALPVALSGNPSPAAVPAPTTAPAPFVPGSPAAPRPAATPGLSSAPAAATHAAASPLAGAASASPPAPATAAGPAGPMPELHLAAISARDGQAVAIVNDRLVREGDSFDGVRVVRIGEAEVEVEFRGRRHVLRF